MTTKTHGRVPFLRLFFFTALAVVISVLVFTRIWVTDKSDTRVSIVRSESRKTILFWNSLFSRKDFYLGEGNVFEKCPKYRNCYTTSDREYVRVERFDAILFHGNELDVLELPEKRSDNQTYIFMNLESPANHPVSHRYFENYFNATMTYRLDSDIPWLYSILRPKDTTKDDLSFSRADWRTPNFSIPDVNRRVKIHKKTKMAAWFVSNCYTRSKREDYVRELKNYIEVDIFGSCGEPLCPKSNNCYEKLETEYFFYLSFENSLCPDYVTEKFFNALRYDVVPVVYGGANYSKFAPPHSYIDALDFESPKKLAEYLTKMAESVDEYEKWFWWKYFYRVDYSEPTTLCKLCEMLNVERSKRVYDPLSSWWSDNDCRKRE